TPDALKAVQGVYEKASPTASIPPGANARAALLENLVYAFDSSLVPWLVKDTLAMKGDDGDLVDVRASALLTALKLAKVDQLGEVDKLGALKADGGSTIGKGFEKEVAATKAVLTECNAKLDCYLGKLADPNSHVGDKAFIGIKAAYMVVIFGSPDVKPKL